MEIRDPGAMDGNPLAAFTMPAEVVAGGGIVRAAGVFRAKVEALDVNPLGLVSVTLISVTPAAPPAAIAPAVTIAVTCVALTNVVSSGVPFHRNTQLRAKPDPVTVRVNEAAPAVAEAGE